MLSLHQHVLCMYTANGGQHEYLELLLLGRVTTLLHYCLFKYHGTAMGYDEPLRGTQLGNNLHQTVFFICTYLYFHIVYYDVLNLEAVLGGTFKYAELNYSIHIGIVSRRNFINQQCCHTLSSDTSPLDQPDVHIPQWP